MMCIQSLYWLSHCDIRKNVHMRIHVKWKMLNVKKCVDYIGLMLHDILCTCMHCSLKTFLKCILKHLKLLIQEMVFSLLTFYYFVPNNKLIVKFKPGNNIFPIADNIMYISPGCRFQQSGRQFRTQEWTWSRHRNGQCGWDHRQRDSHLRICPGNVPSGRKLWAGGW